MERWTNPLWVPLADLPSSAVFTYHKRTGLQFPTSKFGAQYHPAVDHRHVGKIGQPSPRVRAWCYYTTVLAVLVALVTYGFALLDSGPCDPTPSIAAEGRHNVTGSPAADAFERYDVAVCRCPFLWDRSWRFYVTKASAPLVFRW